MHSSTLPAMRKLRQVFNLLLLLLLFSTVPLITAQGSRGRGRKWQTLSGDAPLVIARGGFSGIFPDSSIYAYKLAVDTSLSDVHIWCDIQLTKDGIGICFPYINLENASNIESAYPNSSNTYIVNGVPSKGWFSVDYTFNDLANVFLRQMIYARAPYFDNTQQILTVDDVVSQAKPPNLWLNIQHDAFFSLHNLSMRSFIISASRRMKVDYISSPEMGFLRSIVSRFRKGPTKLVFQILGFDAVEPSTNQTYLWLLSNLKLIKTFASGILVPKNYIWPMDSSLYLQKYSSLVLDAHKAGLQVFASDFANDASLAYDYSYDPVTEYLSFIDNGIFSVDGLVSDFPITPSAAIDCFSHMGKNETVKANIKIISNEGASGDYPGCTDVAYSKAVSGGVDILDCPVQITNDWIPFCLGSMNLRDRTNAAQSEFANLATNNPDLHIQDGIFAYNLTWSQIQSLRPAISNPYSDFYFFRNPKARNVGSLMQLSDFLAFAKNEPSVSGVLISIENAAYLAENQGLGVTDTVLDVLNKSGYNNQTTKKIMIKSSDSAVLSKFKNRGSNYELLYLIHEDISDIFNSTISDIEKFASSVVVSKISLFPVDKDFITGETNVVKKLQAFDLPVYVQLFQNEFTSQPWDFFADAYVEINTYASAMGINGVITDFPATTARYKRNRCLGYKEPPIYMSPVSPGGLFNLIGIHRAAPPNHVLTETDVVEPPLPPATKGRSTGNESAAAPAPTSRNGQPRLVASTMLFSAPLVLAALVLF